MAADDDVSEHYDLSRSYLDTALDSLRARRLEPALFNAYHALELGCKAAIMAKTRETRRTHNVGGVFGRLFRDRVGREDCRSISRVLAKYDFPRYPRAAPLEPEDTTRDIELIRCIILEVVPQLL